MDPRINIIDERLKNAREIIAVSSGKGGVGKSVVASGMALILAERGYDVGLFDLDFTSPSTHLILGIKDVQPVEEKGVIPPKIHGISYMSITYYSGDHPAPLRGEDVSNAIIELLAITRWGELDFLIIDMPPGISDATLDVIRFIRRIKFLIVAAPSKLALETVRKLVRLLSDLGIKPIGILENMKIMPRDAIRKWSESNGVDYLGEIWFDERLEDALGDVSRLRSSKFYGELRKIVENALEKIQSPTRSRRL